MGLRFRKSVKLLPGVRLNFNKNSHSWTFGGKGMHYTVNKKTGTATQSFDLPGGFSYQKRSKIGDDEMLERNKGYNKKPFYKRWWFIAIIVILILYTIGSLSDGTDIENVTIEAESNQMEVGSLQRVKCKVTPIDAVWDDLEFCSTDMKSLRFVRSSSEGLITAGDEPGEWEIWVSWGEGKESERIKIKVVEKLPDKEQPKTESVTVTEPEQQETYVYISSTGSKYHRKANCGNMSNGTKILEEDAKAQGYEPCGRCY